MYVWCVVSDLFSFEYAQQFARTRLRKDPLSLTHPIAQKNGSGAITPGRGGPGSKPHLLCTADFGLNPVEEVAKVEAP